MVAGYIADHAAALKVATLARRLAAISIAHEAKGLPNPVPGARRGLETWHGTLADERASQQGTQTSA
jgi:hypothetical protein